ncbi:MAG: NAD(P)-dependent oxidoreductase [Actinomycetota bacterium]
MIGPDASVSPAFPGLPVMLQCAGRRCVVVGVGAVGRRQIRALVEAGAEVVAIDPTPPIDGSADLGPGVVVLDRPYRPEDLADSFLVVAATDDSAVNRAVTAEAERAGALTLRADDGTLGSLRFPAVHRSGRVTVAVDSGGAGPGVAAHVRNEVAAVDPGWGDLADWAADRRPVAADELAAEAARRRSAS